MQTTATPAISSVSVAEGTDLAAEIAEVRDDATPTRWCLFTYHGKAALKLLGKGKPPAPLQSHSVNSNLNHRGLVRTIVAKMTYFAKPSPRFNCWSAAM